jgi:RNA polymerase sigma-70 factor (ECF subfamily)
MQCVGTLSWNEMGLAWPARRPGDQNLPLRSPAKPSRREQELWREATVAARPQPIPGGETIMQGSGHNGRATHPADEGLSGAAPVFAPVARLARVEAASLEIDWSQIVRQCMAGDSGAWAELVRAQHRRVYGLCYRFTGNATDAEDLTQDVFLKIYSNLTSFDLTRGSLHVWITTMTRNLLVDNFRRTRNQRATSSLDDGWESAEDLKPIDRLTARGPSPHESAAQKELAKMVQDALARVSVELREAVILRDLQDLDYKEIAQVLGIPEGTVKSRISRGRAELARLLERTKREVM